MDRVVVDSFDGGVDIPPKVPTGAVHDSDLRTSREWEGRFRRRRTFALVESYLSSNCFILIFLFAYVNALVLMYIWGARDEYVHQKGHPQTWMITIARGFGYTLNLTCALVIILAARLSFTLLRETALNRILPFDKTFPAFHILVGYSIMAAVVGHGIFHCIWIVVWNGWGPGIWGINWCVATGFILASTLVLMVATAGHKYRSKNFTVFYSIHNIGAAIFFVLLGLHGMYRGKPYTFKWITGPVILYLIDRGVRKLSSSQVSIHLSTRNSVLKGPDVLKISIPKSFNYKAGQYAEIKVPSISKTEWHPFTIASAPHEAEMTFFVKAVGDWTKALYHAFLDRIDGRDNSTLPILVRGPYGAPAQHVGGYERIVLVSGGVGSTPFSSICRELHHYIQQQSAGVESDNRHFGTPSVDSKVEEQITKVLNNKFSVAYGSPKLPTRNSRIHEIMRDELYHLADGMTPKPAGASIFQRYDMADLFVESARAGDRSRTNRTMPQAPPKAALKKKIGSSFVRKKVGSSFIGSENMYGSPESLMMSEVTAPSPYTEGKKVREEFEDNMMHLDDHDVAIKMEKDLGVHISRGQRLLGVLHSIFLNLVVFLLLLTRLIIVGYAHIFGVFMFRINKMEFTFTGARWLFITDLVLGSIVTALVVGTIMLELFVFGRRFLQNMGQRADLFALTPLTIASVALECVILGRQTNDVKNSLLAAILFTFVLPATAVFLGLRLHRIVGARVMLADSIDDVAYHNVRAVDFIWTTPHAADDSWLLERLIPITHKTKLRLHRYITRDSPDDAGDGTKHDDKALHTNFGYVLLLLLHIHIFFSFMPSNTNLAIYIYIYININTDDRIGILCFGSLRSGHQVPAKWECFSADLKAWQRL